MSGYWFIVYAYNLDPRVDAAQRVQNAVLDERPFDWLMRMRSEHPKDDFQLMNFWEISASRYGQLKGRVG